MRLHTLVNVSKIIYQSKKNKYTQRKTSQFKKKIRLYLFIVYDVMR